MRAPIDIDWNPGSAKLRQFGAIGCGVFAALGFAAWREGLLFASGLGAARVPLASALGALAALCALFAVLWPRGNRPLYLALTALALPLGWAVSYALLFALFFLLITPIALLLRVLRKDPLARAADPGSQSYWDVAERERPKADYFRQF